LAVIAAIFAFAIRGILGPFLIAAVLALILNPLVNLVERYRVPRVAAIIGIYAAGLVLFGAGIAFVAPLARQEFIALVKQGPAVAAYFQDLAGRHHAPSTSAKPTAPSPPTCPPCWPATSSRWSRTCSPFSTGSCRLSSCS
jgi:predicted PurR-regulated permease PerM